jgi:hypothetical protein
MSTTPSEPGGPNIPMGQTLGSPGSIARLPMPGNAELAVYVIVEFIFVLIWIIADSVNTQQWVLYTTILTAFYILSRGIAKASRVLEA